MDSVYFKNAEKHEVHEQTKVVVDIWRVNAIIFDKRINLYKLLPNHFGIGLFSLKFLERQEWWESIFFQIWSCKIWFIDFWWRNLLTFYNESYLSVTYYVLRYQQRDRVEFIRYMWYEEHIQNSII